jgi:hypothetical protein
LDKHLRLVDDEGNTTALNTADAYVNLLNILITSKKNEEIQNELLDLVGFHNFELLEKLIERREIIKEQCKLIHEKMQQEKQGSDYKGKNMDLINAPGATVSISYEKPGGKKGGKKGGAKFNQAQMENIKISNYDLLLKLGFDREFIDENKRLGLREKQMESNKQKYKYMLGYERQRRENAAQVFEQNELKKHYTIHEEDNDEYKFV